MEKKYYFVSALVLFPIMLFLGLMLIKGYVNGMIYTWIFVLSFVSFWISFIFSILFTANDIIYSDNRKRIFSLLFIPFIYLPIYYVKNVLGKKCVYGIASALLNIILLTGLFVAVKNYTEQYMHEKYLEGTPIFYTLNK